MVVGVLACCANGVGKVSRRRTHHEAHFKQKRLFVEHEANSLLEREPAKAYAPIVGHRSGDLIALNVDNGGIDGEWEKLIVAVVVSNKVHTNIEFQFFQKSLR